MRALMADPTGVVFRIARYSVHDGPGIRTTVFLKGCPLRCLWCHSPESQRRPPELLVHPDRCIGCGTCLTVCPHHAAVRIDGRADGRSVPGPSCVACGTCVASCPQRARQVVGWRATVAQVLTEIEKDRSFYDESAGGVTFSGGEPLAQPGFLRALLAACRARDIRTAIETSGYAPRSAFAAIQPFVDLFLYDVKLMDDRRHRAATGVSNRRVLSNLQALVADGARPRLRIPLVPGVNDDADNLQAVGRFVRTLGMNEVDLLPYHRAGLAKYARLNRPYLLADTPEPTTVDIDRAKDLFRQSGVSAHVGG